MEWPRISPGAPFDVKRLEAAPEGANGADAWNRLWRAASSDLVVLLDANVEMTDPLWLQALMTFAMDEGVGGVGGRVWTEQGDIAHAGLVGGLLGPFAAAWGGEPSHVRSYQDWASVQREWSMLGGGVLATRQKPLVGCGRVRRPLQRALPDGGSLSEAPRPRLSDGL